MSETWIQHQTPAEPTSLTHLIYVVLMHTTHERLVPRYPRRRRVLRLLQYFDVPLSRLNVSVLG